MKKKILALILAGVMTLSVTGCGEAKKVTELIDTIGTVTLESKTVIEEAQQAFEALSDKDKEKVENSEVLGKALTDYESLLREKEITEKLIAEKWIAIESGRNYLELSDDGTGCASDYISNSKIKWEITDEKIHFTLANGTKIDYSIIESDGKEMLSCDDPSHFNYCKESEYDEVSVFVTWNGKTQNILGNSIPDITDSDGKFELTPTSGFEISKLYSENIARFKSACVGQYVIVTSTITDIKDKDDMFINIDDKFYHKDRIYMNGGWCILLSRDGHIGFSDYNKGDKVTVLGRILGIDSFMDQIIVDCSTRPEINVTDEISV